MHNPAMLHKNSENILHGKNIIQAAITLLPKCTLPNKLVFSKHNLCRTQSYVADSFSSTVRLKLHALTQMWQRLKNYPSQQSGANSSLTEGLKSGQVLWKGWASPVWSNCISLGLSPGASLHFINHMNVCFILLHCSHWSLLLQVFNPPSSNITFLST